MVGRMYACSTPGCQERAVVQIVSTYNGDNALRRTPFCPFHADAFEVGLVDMLVGAIRPPDGWHLLGVERLST